MKMMGFRSLPNWILKVSRPNWSRIIQQSFWATLSNIFTIKIAQEWPTNALICFHIIFLWFPRHVFLALSNNNNTYINPRRQARISGCLKAPGKSPKSLAFLSSVSRNTIWNCVSNCADNRKSGNLGKWQMWGLGGLRSHFYCKYY